MQTVTIREAVLIKEGGINGFYHQLHMGRVFKRLRGGYVAVIGNGGLGILAPEEFTYNAVQIPARQAP